MVQSSISLPLSCLALLCLSATCTTFAKIPSHLENVAMRAGKIVVNPLPDTELYLATLDACYEDHHRYYTQHSYFVNRRSKRTELRRRSLLVEDSQIDTSKSQVLPEKNDDELKGDEKQPPIETGRSATEKPTNFTSGVAEDAAAAARMYEPAETLYRSQYALAEAYFDPEAYTLQIRIQTQGFDKVTAVHLHGPVMPPAGKPMKKKAVDEHNAPTPRETARKLAHSDGSPFMTSPEISDLLPNDGADDEEVDPSSSASEPISSVRRPLSPRYRLIDRPTARDSFWREIRLSESEALELYRGELYLDIHTRDEPRGAIRGFLACAMRNGKCTPPKSLVAEKLETEEETVDGGGLWKVSVVLAGAGGGEEEGLIVTSNSMAEDSSVTARENVDPSSSPIITTVDVEVPALFHPVSCDVRNPLPEWLKKYSRNKLQ